MELTLPTGRERGIPLDPSAPSASVEKATTVPKKRWSEFVLGVKEKYQTWKKDLVQRTDKTLEQAADAYITQAEAERDAVTGEVPSSYLKKFTRGFEALRKSSTLQSRFDLAIRTALPFVEFNTQMAFKQFGVDIAIRQAEYTELKRAYSGKEGGMEAVERQALKFAEQVQAQFLRLNEQAGQLPPEAADDQEGFRQQKIAEGLEYAQEILKGIELVDESAKTRVLAELRTYLDTVVYDPKRPGVLQRWDKLGRGYRGAIQDIMNKHVDIFQKRAARNTSIITTSARWLTFGLEAYVLNRISSAASTLSANYDKVLMQTPAEQRTVAKRMQGFAESVKESVLQFAMTDAYRQLRESETAIDSMIDKELFSYDWESGLSREFPVDEVTKAFYTKFSADLQRRGITEQQIREIVKSEAFKIGNRREQLADTLKYRVLQLHKDQVKAAAKQAEHVYNQFNVNYMAVQMLADIDATTDQLLHVQEHVGTMLEGLSQQATQVTTAVAQSEAVNMASGLVAEVTQAMTSLTQEKEAAQPTVVELPVYQPGDEEAPLLTTDPVNDIQHHTVVAKETLWSIATNHLEAYRAREGNEDLTVVDVIHLIQKENNIEDASKIEIGTDLKLAAWVAPEVMWEENQSPDETGYSEADVKTLARQVDQHQFVDRFVAGVTRENIHDLPAGEYEMVLGERLGKASGRMPVHYSEVAHLSVDTHGTTVVREIGEPEWAGVPLDFYLTTHASPIVRVFQAEQTNIDLTAYGVFQVEGNRLALPGEHIHQESMSQYNQALIRYLQDHPITVLDKSGAYCAKDMAARLDLFDSSLAADVGINLRDAQGRETGVTTHAPMLAETVVTSGGQRVASLNEFFAQTDGTTHPTETLESSKPEYRAGVKEWLTQAAESPLRLGTFLFTGTHIQGIIAANSEIGGEANSHVVTLLGEKDLTSPVEVETTVAKLLRVNYGISGKALDDRGWIFESLGVEVRTPEGDTLLITDKADWEQLTLHPGETLVVHDVALNHRFNGDRADTLAMMMVRTPDLLPVSILEPNGQVMNEALAYKGEPNDYVVDTFEQVRAGDTLGNILERSGLDPSLWPAAEFVLTERGIDPAHVEPGDLVPIYNAADLREHVDEIYERAERRLAQQVAADSDTGVHYAAADRTQAEQALETEAVEQMELVGTTYWHIVRPNESMDDLTQQFFERSRYSAAEWNTIRTQVADQMGIPHAQVQMPGDEFTAPYTINEYQLTAEAELPLTLDQLRAIDRSIEQARLTARTYLPEAIPIYTSEGMVEQTIPAEVRGLIDTVVTSHPEYGDDVRVALGLIYANEGMREEAEKNAFSEQLAAMNTDGSLDQAIEKSEYFTSRQFLKDVAWKIHDSPYAHYALQEVISSFESGFASREAYLGRMADLSGGIFPAQVAEDYYDAVPARAYDQLVKLEGVSSAGLFQVRANNFVPEGTPEFEQLERDLRADPLLNTTAAAELTHQNSRVIDTYIQAFGDPKSHDEQARILALVNSYNGGPYKTILGGLQANLLQLEQASHVETSLDRATGRNTTETREAFEALCLGLAEQGKLQVSPEQIQADAALLGSHTISFLRSETMQELKQVYANEVGQPMSLLPNSSSLGQEYVSYGNYAYLATRAGALDVILEHSEKTRLAQGNVTKIPYARTEAPFVSGNVG